MKKSSLMLLNAITVLLTLSGSPTLYAGCGCGAKHNTEENPVQRESIAQDDTKSKTAIKEQ